MATLTHDLQINRGPSRGLGCWVLDMGWDVMYGVDVVKVGCVGCGGLCKMERDGRSGMCGARWGVKCGCWFGVLSVVVGWRWGIDGVE